jgi:hypothetical protein
VNEIKLTRVRETVRKFQTEERFGRHWLHHLQYC